MDRNLAIFDVRGGYVQCNYCYANDEYLCDHDPEPGRCTCISTRVTFFPANYADLYYPTLPSTVPQETSYVVTVERAATDEQLFTETIDPEVEHYGFTVCDVDSEGIIPLLEVLYDITRKYEFSINPRAPKKRIPFQISATFNSSIKKSEVYTRVACEKLTEMVLALKSRDILNVEEEKKENPHMGKRRKKKK